MRIRITAILLALALMLGGVNFADKVNIFDTSNLAKGIVGVSYTDTAGGTYKVMIQKGEQKVAYPLIPNGKTEYFPLQLGNGEYVVALVKQVQKGKYAFVEQTKVKNELKDESVVYLNSIQNINWNEKDDAIKYAFNQTKDVKTAQAAFEIFYDYMVKNVVYDWDKAKTAQPDYVPSISKTFVDSKGICYDYSSMFASFMRSKGFPTRLVKGYTDNVEGYHAWNEILIDGKWMVVDTTYDAGTKDFSVKFKPFEQYRKVYDY